MFEIMIVFNYFVLLGERPAALRLTSNQPENIQWLSIVY